VNWLEWINVASAVGISTALNSLWLGLLLASLAAGMIHCLPRSNATTRYAVWFTALILVVATPAMLLIPRPAPAAAASAFSLPSPLPSAPFAVPVTAHWPVFIGVAWLVITALLLARAAWSLAHIQGLKRRATRLGQRGQIRVLASAEVAVPMAAGFFRRAIVFPQAVLDELTPQEFEQVLCHEMAHLRRWDDWTQLAHAIAQAVFFFNPAIYWIGRRLKIEREMACDDWVVSATGEPRPYAACLTHLHEVTRRAPAPQLAPGATSGSRWQISNRVEALLQPDRNSTPRFSRSGWMTACALVTAGLIVAARATPPVGVEEIPLSTMVLASVRAPAAPAIALTPQRFVPPRPRLLSSRMRAPELPAPPELASAPVVLVRAWQVEVSPTYYVIAVVFFAPPPHAALNGI
jgi:beta-lactamase regulating signal transducer with metallopeptidase domain